MPRVVLIAFIAFYCMWYVVFEATVTEGKNLYISRAIGDDTSSCDQMKPCKTIWRAVSLASSGDHIHLDGTNTDKDPYKCSSGSSHRLVIYVNKSLSLIGSSRPMPRIRCTEGTGFTFYGSENEEQVNVTISGLRVDESFVSIQDSSIYIDGCKFENSKHGVYIIIYARKVVDVQITNSAFSGNSECISLIANGSNISSHNTQVMFKLKNSSFNGNVLSDGNGCISLTALSNDNYTVFSNITLADVIFSRNKFSSKGLIFLEIKDGKQQIQLENVKFIDNSPSSGQDFLECGSETEFIIRSSDVSILINSSHFCSQRARLLNATTNNITIQVYNSSFFGSRVKGNGGVISLRSSVCTCMVYNSSFVNTVAARGGAINIESVSVKVSLEGNSFKDNMASDEQGGGGGAFYIFSPSFLGEAEAQERTIEGAPENYLQINISRCNFTNSYSSSVASALRATAVKVIMRLRESLFINCTAIDKERMGGSGAVFVAASLPSLEETSDQSDLVLTVERSRFIRCSGSVYFGASLVIVYKAQVEINITESHFISNDGGAVAVQAMASSFIERWVRNTSHVTLKHSKFINNSVTEDAGGAVFIGVYNQSIVSLENVTMESNKAGTFGGAVSLTNNCTLKVSKSRFLQNTARGCGGALYLFDINSLQVEDSFFDQNHVCSTTTGSLQVGGALCITSKVLDFKVVSIFNTKFLNCLAKDGGGAIFVDGSLRLVVNSTLLIGNVVLNGFGGALKLSLRPDTLKNPGCKEELRANQTIDDAKEFPSWLYRSHLTFENTTFERNAAVSAGALYLTNGKATFQNCYFMNNFASSQGGNLFTVPGSASLIVRDSVFRQTISELHESKTVQRNYSIASFIHTASSGALKLYNTTFELAPYGSIGPFVLARNGRLVDLGNNNLTLFNCPVGSQVELVDVTDEVKTQVNNLPCTIDVTTLKLSCSACEGNSYSLQRGRALGSQLEPGFQCVPCPFGANCSQNVIAKPNFWGFRTQQTIPLLHFRMCPLDYCSPPDSTEFPEYNGCQGSRSGELCGQCGDGYSETLYSTNCRLSNECDDWWFWPLALLYVLVMAMYFTFKPPVIPWIKRQILWFKKYETANEEWDFDRGYLKIVFYLYQAADLVMISNSSQQIFKSQFVEPFVGLFNFQEKFSSGGLVCPFPGLTVVTKRLFSASHVFATCFMIAVFYMVHCGVQKLRSQGTPSAGLYVGGILQTMLLGYTTLASISFELLRCVPIGSEDRLFYDGNVVCFDRWQYILIAFICVYFVPFVFVLLWGPVKLFRGSISVGKFLCACCFPLPWLLYWVFACCRAGNASTLDSATGQECKVFVERVIYDPFKRPQEGGKLSLSWESIMIGRRLILIIVRAFVSNPMPRLVIMILLCVFFLLHHALTQPFRDRTANIAETISLLLLVFLATVNVFFASFLSLAVSFNDHFTTWWSFCEVVEFVIICVVPLGFCFLLAAAVFSQLSRLLFFVGVFLRKFLQVCFKYCSYRRETDETRPLLT